MNVEPCDGRIQNTLHAKFKHQISESIEKNQVNKGDSSLQKIEIQTNSNGVNKGLIPLESNLCMFDSKIHKINIAF